MTWKFLLQMQNFNYETYQVWNSVFRYSAPNRVDVWATLVSTEKPEARQARVAQLIEEEARKAIFEGCENAHARFLLRGLLAGVEWHKIAENYMDDVNDVLFQDHLESVK